MAETLDLRRQLARLLGFDDYTGYSLATKMADSPDQVLGFLEQLAEKSRQFRRQCQNEPKAERT